MDKNTNTETTSAQSLTAEIVAYDSLYKTVEATNKAQDASRFRQDDENIELQRIACSHILHLGKHRDIMVIRRFLENGMAENNRKDSMVAFFEKYAQVNVDGEGEITFAKDKRTDMAGALSKAWYKMTKPSIYKGWVFSVELAKFLEAAEKHANKPKVGDEVTPMQIAALVKLRNDLHSQESTETVAVAA